MSDQIIELEKKCSDLTVMVHMNQFVIIALAWAPLIAQWVKG